MTRTDHPTERTPDPARHLDARRRDLVDAARRAVLHEPDRDGPGLPDALRVEIAALVARTAAPEPRESDDADEQGTSTPPPPGPFPARQEARAFAEQMATEPATLREQDLARLRAAGMSPAQIIAVAQVVGFSAFEARLELVARALDEPTAAAPPEGDLVDAPEQLPHPRTRFAMRGWVGWLPLGGRDEDFPVKDNQKPNDYYRVLVHDPEALTHRTALYDELLRGEGESTVEQREMAALAVSLTTPCDFCASVHGRRHFLAGRDPRSSVELDHGGPGAVTDPVQRAIARFGRALGAVRPQVPSAAVALLRGHGLSDRGIAEIGAVGAMFAWANRLMTGLGEPTD